MTPERIAELRVMCERATPGPWRPGLDSRVHAEGDEFDGLVGDFCDNKEPDIAFIAAARAALPECLAEIERLQSQMAEMAKDLQQAVRLIGDVNDKYVAAKNEVKRLRQAVADVEHEFTCTNWQNGGPCNCCEE